MPRVSSSGGIDLAVHDLGGGGPPALLAHATGFHGLVWAPVARRLSSLHCLAPDLRGHGDSPAPDDHDFAWEGFADDVLAVVGALDLDHPVGIGHSSGAAALLLAEARRPGTFRTLWCYEPVVFPSAAPDPGAVEGSDGNPGGGQLARSARMRRERFDSFAAAEANFASKPPMAAFDPEARRLYVAHGFRPDPEGGVRLKCRPEGEARVYEMGAHHPAWGLLDAVICPVTVVRGSTDGSGPAAMSGQVADRLPHGRLEAHDDLDHFGPMTAPGAVAASILAALAPG